MTKILVNNKTILDELYEDNALTKIGLSDNDTNLNLFINWIKEYTPLKEEVFYIIKGSLMNTVYGLTDSNAYKPDLTIVCIKLSSMVNPSAIIIPRFEINGRWFNDVVDNNSYHQKNQ